MLFPKHIRNGILSSIVVTLAGLGSQTFAHDRLDYPNEGDEFAPGDTIIIRWSNLIVHTPIGWDLYFSTDGGDTFSPIKLGMPVDQFSYQWVVPNIITDNAAVKIVQNNEGPDYSDTHFFKITNTPGQMNTGQVVTSIDPAEIPDFGIRANFPNPFSVFSTIQFAIPADSYVSLKIFDAQGRLVQTLLNRKMKKGEYAETWNAGDIPKGIYFIRLDSDEIHDSHRALVW